MIDPNKEKYVREARPYRVAVFGGSFDPWHEGHAQLLDELVKDPCWDRIEVLPCKMPVHKAPCHQSAEARVEALRPLQKLDERIRVNTLEMDRETPSYAIETVKTLQAESPDAALVWVMGKDAWEGMDSWQEAHAFPDHCHVLVAPRGEWDVPEREPWRRYAHWRDFPDWPYGGMAVMKLPRLCSVSSTQIRS